MKDKITHTHKVIVIVGTNASGKSSLAIDLAKKFNGEVISADSRQVYKGLDIGSGKVTNKEMKGVPHHLIDVANPKKRFSAADFKRLGEKALEDIWSRDKVPIIAGGTGFYIDALIGGANLAHVPPNEALRKKLEAKTVKQLFVHLKKLDPKRAEDLKKKGEHNHKRRIIRAIEIATTASQHPLLTVSQQGVLTDSRTLWVGLKWDDANLRKRIHDRLLARMKMGMAAEVSRLHKKGLSWKRMEELGLEYRYLSRYLRGKLTKEKMLEQLETKTWQYARRQRTWFKRNKKIRWFKASEKNKVGKLVRSFLR